MTSTSSKTQDMLSGRFADDLSCFELQFQRSSDIIIRRFKITDVQQGAMILLDGLSDIEAINQSVLKPFFEYQNHALITSSGLSLPEIMTILHDRLISNIQLTISKERGYLMEQILSGDTVILIEGVNQALLLGSRKWNMRPVEEPATEAVIRGPREGFTEDLRTNTSLIRRRLKTLDLKMEAMKAGTESSTAVVITYLENKVRVGLLEEIKARIQAVDSKVILDSGIIENLIADNPVSVFPQMISTERPDKVVAGLSEGKAAILVDNSPFALLLPVTFNEMLKASEDNYEHKIFAKIVQTLRFFMMISTLFLPSLYIAITTFHQEMIPITLLLSVASSREAIPFPSFVEALIMEVSFEALREAGVRLPRPVGQAVSIVGALIIGQAAVNAGIVSATMIIIVSITGISSFIFPTFSQGIAIRLLRFPMMLFAATFGLYGILMGCLCLLIHMCNLSSFGSPYLKPIISIKSGKLLQNSRSIWLQFRKLIADNRH
ncbi:spore germination protein [Paenibacillus sp. TC-CSREp1]|uniref:spore germination protein n=1 Tax=Paenibacillus sp. TC-CSREp1 TaxID=3410089 RepID=UPI003CFA630F